MHCSRCGHELTAPSSFCPNCGQPLSQSASGASPGPIQDEAETDPKAAISMVLGVLSILLSVFVGVPAIILGHLSRASIRKSGGRLKGDGMALAGLITGYISLFLLPVIAGVFFVAVPNIFRIPIVNNESAAISTLKTIRDSAESYQLENQHYPPSLQELSANGLKPLDSKLAATGLQSGYRFTYKLTSETTYVIHADPMYINSGERHFFMDQTGVIRADKTRRANAGSEPISPLAE